MSYNKRVTNKIRSVRRPLIKDDENWLNSGSIGRNWTEISGLGFLGGGSEKGRSRKHTGNRVTRWGFMFRGNFWKSR
jgi:hypothetical protein